MDDKKNSKPNLKGIKPLRRQNNFWKYMIVVFLLWIGFFYLFRTGGPDRTAIPYSKFKQQVEKGNISEVTFQTEEINGKFKNEYHKIEGKDTTSYKFFTSVKPSFQDPDLMQKLEANNVIIN